MGIVVTIAGSRDLCDNGKQHWGLPVNRAFRDGTWIIERAVLESGFSIDKVLSGGAIGIDTAAVEWAKEKGLPYEVFPAHWHKYGRRAGILRNIDMTMAEQGCIAIWDGKSRGTRHKIVTSQAAGSRIYVLKTTVEELWGGRD